MLPRAVCDDDGGGGGDGGVCVCVCAYVLVVWAHLAPSPVLSMHMRWIKAVSECLVSLSLAQSINTMMLN